MYKNEWVYSGGFIIKIWILKIPESQSQKYVFPQFLDENSQSVFFL